MPSYVKHKNDSGYFRRKMFPRKIGEVVDSATSNAFRKRGFTQREIITKWRIIVGNVLADFTLPKKISFSHRFVANGNATLTVQTEPAFALELQHLEEQVLERINSYFGYLAVQKLHIVQAPLPIRKAKKETSIRRLSPETAKALSNQLSQLKTPILAKALHNLGSAIRTKKEEE